MIKTAAEKEAFVRAFFEELDNLAIANGFHNSDALIKTAHIDVDELIKEAIIGAALKKGLQGLKGGLRKGKDFVSGAPLEVPGVGSIPMHKPGAQGLLGGVGKSLESSGKSMMTGPSTKNFSMGQLQSAGIPGAPGVGQRIAGSAVHDIGHHISHKGVVGNALNPFGAVLGGAGQGVHSQVGKELQGLGKRIASNPALESLRAEGMQVPLSGAARFKQGLGAAVGGAGKVVERSAKPIGLMGEMAGVAGIGTLAHAPLSSAGALGGKLLSQVPGANQALHGLGGYAHHLGADMLGTGVQAMGTRMPAVARGAAAGVGRVLPWMAANARNAVGAV